MLESFFSVSPLEAKREDKVWALAETRKMAESAVVFVMEKLNMLIQVEYVKGGVRSEIECIKDELVNLRMILRQLEELREMDSRVEVCVKEIADVVHDMEDLLDGFELTRSNRYQNESSWFKLLRLHVFGETIHFHRLLSQFRRIKPRLTLLSDTLRHFSNESVYGIEAQPGSTGSTASRITSWDIQRRNSLLLEDKDVVGIERSRKQLISWLVEDGNDGAQKVISICGMGGLGKTTLAKNIYDRDEVSQRFHVRAWLTVSHSFKIEVLLIDMLQQLSCSTRSPIVPQEVSSEASVDKLRVEIKDILRRNRYLVVLDDIWSTTAWEALQYVFPDNCLGSRLIITTRHREVAVTSSTKSTTGGGWVYDLQPLSKEVCWDLFCRMSFQGNSCPPYLEEISHRILSKCQGYPLAIKAVSGILSRKDTSTIYEWEMVYHNLSAKSEDNYLFHSIKNIFSLSYIDLPYFLKPCLLYLSVFPEQHLIDRMRLIRLWIAEGFVMKKAGKTLEDVAEDYLHELLDRNWIQVAETTIDGRVHTCRVHNVVHNFIIYRSMICQKFALVSGEHISRVLWPEKIRHLSVHNNLKEVPQDSKSISRLHSLFMFGMSDPDFQESLFSLPLDSSKLLRVLDLRGSSLNKVPVYLSRLLHLRYLSFRDTKIKKLPSSIGKLINLETLDLKRTDITELPPEVSNLHQLRHLIVYTYKMEDYMPYASLYACKPPPGIGGLLSLQKLSFIESNTGDGVLEELSKLEKLRRLGIAKLKKEHGPILSYSIEKLTNLQSLNIHSNDRDEIIDLEHLSSPPRFIQRLYLHGRLEKLPSWITQLNSLVKLILRWSSLTDNSLSNFLSHLGGLPNLRELQLREAYRGDELRFQAEWFQKLKILLLDGLDGLKYVCVEEGGVPFVEEMTIMRCQDLEKVPDGIQHLRHLKKLQFLDMPNEIYKSVQYNPDNSDGDFWKVKHIPNFWFTVWKNGRWNTHTLHDNRSNAEDVQDNQ